MKYIFLILAFGLVSVGSAQITIRRQHVADNGFAGIFCNDNVTFAPLSEGANQTWDLTGLLKPINVFQMRMQSNSWFPGYVKFPGANHCIVRSDEDSNFQYLTIDQTMLRNEGTYSVSNGVIGVSKVKLTMLKFPAQYNDSWDDTINIYGGAAYLGQDVDSTGPLKKIDSFRFSITFHVRNIISGWGTLNTLSGNYQTLQVKSKRELSDNLQYYNGGIWADMPAAMLDSFKYDRNYDTTFQVFYWTDQASAGWPVLIYNYGISDKKVNTVQWLLANNVLGNTAPIVNQPVFYPNPAFDFLAVSGAENGEIILKDISGKLVRKTTVVNGKISLQGLATGYYLAEYYRENGVLEGRMKVYHLGN